MEQNSSGIRKVPLIRMNVQLTSESFFLLFLGLIWSQSVLVAYLKVILMRTPYITYAEKYIIAFIFLASLILALPYMVKRIPPQLFLVYISVAFVYLINFILFPLNRTALEANLLPFLFRALPLIFVGVAIDLKKHYNFLYLVSLISAICAIVRTLINPVKMDEGDMHSSYVLLPHLCMVMVAALEKKNWLDILVSLVGAFVIIAFGSRGPILCMLSLLVMYMLINKKVHKHIWFFATVIVLLAITTLMYEEMLLLLREFVQKIGLSTRVFDLMFSGELIESTGRDRIQNTLIEAVSQNLLGYGIAGDRAFVGTYAHNVLIEFWVSYGVFVGSALFAVFSYYVVKLLVLKSKSFLQEDGLILVLLSSSFVRLLMSGSYLTESFLYMMIGLMIAELQRRSKGNQ